MDRGGILNICISGLGACGLQMDIGHAGKAARARGIAV
jgi:hypothetical protein